MIKNVFLRNVIAIILINIGIFGLIIGFSVSVTPVSFLVSLYSIVIMMMAIISFAE